MTRRLTATALVAFAAFAATPARAGLLPVSVAVTPEAGNFRWTYAVVLPSDSQLRAGDYFTIYDFAGYVPGTNSQPDGWTFAASPTGPTPARLNPADDPALPNLTFAYSGPTLDGGGPGLGNFWAVSAYEAPGDSFFTARTHRTSDGRLDSNITETTVPVPVPPGAPPGVPEPTTLALAGLGLPLLALARRRRAG